MSSNHLLATLALTLATGAAWAHGPATATSVIGPSSTVTTSTRHVVHMKAKYEDENGKPISAEAFKQAKKAGRNFTMTPDFATKTAILKLVPASAGSAAGAGSGSGTMTMFGGGGLALHTGQRLPPFHLPTVGGGHVSNASLRGKTTLVDFFFAECVACIMEVPALNAWAEQHPNVNFLAVTFDDAETAKAFVAKRHFAWPIAYSGMSLDQALGISSYPTLMLFDASGTLRATNTGSIPFEGKGLTAEQGVQWLDTWVQQGLRGSTDTATSS